MNVMLIDPNYNRGYAIVEFLEVLGITCEHFIHTTDALNKWRENKEPYDLILLDENPNEYDFDKVISEIRDNDLNVPIIGLSADADKLAELLSHGASSAKINDISDDLIVVQLAEEIRRLIAQWR